MTSKSAISTSLLSRPRANSLVDISMKVSSRRAGVFLIRSMGLPRVIVASLVLLSASAVNSPQETMAAGDGSKEAFFRQRIEPVLQTYCFSCHSAQADEVAAGLRFDSPLRLAEGGDSGPVIDTDNVDRSLLLRALRHQDGLEMPLDQAALPSEVVADFVKWIEMGAPDPRGELPTASGADDVSRSQESWRSHWAFQPVERPAIPRVIDNVWVRSPVDAFILARLENRTWRPASMTDKATWIRRVTFDLTGLPPTLTEVVAFQRDSSPFAFEKVVDRLLASPRYGERWAQHWLDVVRYAESEGFEYDRRLPGAWRFRDYVIAAFNRDKPFDQFVREQLAGDELDSADTELLSASVFHRLGAVRRNAGNPEIALSRNEVLTERTNILGEAFLGLTVGCARCHNHKLEPISQRDYYRLQAYLAATEEHDTLLVSASERAEYERSTKRIELRRKQLRELLQTASAEELPRIRRELTELAQQQPVPPPMIPGIRDNLEKRTPIHVLRRGNWDNKGDVVGPRPLQIFVADDLPELPADTANPRSALADWLTDARHPLTARVIVNRLWQAHFGAGIVETTNDFGTHGGQPSHPELLDWLASELVAHGWRLKPLQRLIVLSSAYRMSTQSPETPEYATVDPANRLLWRFNRRRLTAEELRDSMLAVSGQLNLQVGGASVMTPVDPELTKLLYDPKQWTVTADTSQHCRRSIYLMAKRNLRLPFFEAFDAPALQTSCPRRQTSTHGIQALEMLNGTLSNQMATAFANRLEVESHGDPQQIVRRAFRLALGRAPSDEECRLSVAFLGEQTTTEFALAIFNLNGFCYLE